MPKEYVELRDGGRWIAGTRVSLDSVVVAFREGLSPETIAAECFPSLSLEEVYGAITYYLAHRREVDAALAAADAEFEALHRAHREAEPEFYRRLAEARRQPQTSRP